MTRYSVFRIAVTYVRFGVGMGVRKPLTEQCQVFVFNDFI